MASNVAASLPSSHVHGSKRPIPLLATAAGLVALDPVSPAVYLGGRDVAAVAVDGDVVWALVERRELHWLAAGRVELVAALGDAVGSCLVVHGGRPWVGGNDAGLWRLVGDELEAVQSFGLAPTHDEWHTPWGGPPSIFSLASLATRPRHNRSDRHDGSALVVSVHVGGILRSDDDGASWAPTIAIEDDVHQVTVGPDGRLWAATGRRGLAESADRGATWRYHGEGLHSPYAMAVAATTEGVLLGVSSGPRAGDGALYRFDGHRFEPCRGGLPVDLGGVVGPGQLAAIGNDAVVALPGGDVHTSPDGGRTWPLATSASAPVNQVVMAPALATATTGS